MLFADHHANVCVITEGGMGGISFEFTEGYGGYASIASWSDSGIHRATINLGVVKAFKSFSIAGLLGAYETYIVSRRIGLFKGDPGDYDIDPLPKFTWVQRWKYGIGLGIGFFWKYFTGMIKYMRYDGENMWGFSFGLHVEQGL